jgi:UDP:flavonoid glycosyltransferase YjiC (YdhE family)
MRVLFVTWWGGGNVTPVRVLTPQLVAGGHAVRVLGPARLRPELEAAGADYVEQEGGFTATAEELVAALDGADAVVVDFMLPDLMAVAEASGTPWAPLVHTLAQPILDDLIGITCAFVPLDRVNEVRRDLGLDPAARPAELLGRADRILVVGPEAIDRPPTRPPPSAPLRRLGAMVEPPLPPGSWSAPAGDGPLVLVCLGTTPMDEQPVLERVLEALGRLPVRGLLTAGAHLAPASFDAPANVLVTGYVPHASVLPVADLVVTHAGLGTITASLAFGVPLLCLPLGRDQFQNAERVLELGAGESLPSDADPSRIADAVARLLADDDLRSRVRRLAQTIEAESRPGRALAEIVALAGP